MRTFTRRQVALIVAAVFAFIALAVGIYGLATGPSLDRGDRQAQSLAGTTGPDAQTDVLSTEPSRRPLPRTNDPIEFARAVAAALFDWDTADGFLPADFQAPVLADADPSGEETPRLIDDIATYMPTVDQWLDLATMNVSQSLTIDSAQVPASWPSVVAQAHGQLRPGTTAVTITGTRERDGIWKGENAATSSPVSFTVFVACQPTFDRCHVLRLSQLDNPLR
jgi:predicted component of type VI protein secretion system